MLHLDEPTWTGAAAEVRDSSGLGNHGTLSSAGLSTVASPVKWGRAGLFDGDRFVVVGDNASLRPTSALTVSAWFYRTANDGIERGIIAKRVGWKDQDTFSIFVWGGDTRDASSALIYVDIDDDNDRFSSNPAFPLGTNTWYHVALVYDGTRPSAERVRLYLNGVVQGVYDGSHNLLSEGHPETSAEIPVSYLSPLHVGDLRSGGEKFIGAIDEVAMWTRALTQAEVMTLYNASAALK